MPKPAPICRPLPRHVRARAQLLMAGMLAGLSAVTPASAADTSPAEQARYWNAQAGASGDALRGERFFRERHGKKWSCSSCHQAPPTTSGKHAATGKQIDPLAPSFNPRAFTEIRRIEKWFRRNCNDVLDRECTPAEKADLLAYLLSLGR